jgi:peptidyl-prolyl cis-trans isomerase SurA
MKRYWAILTLAVSMAAGASGALAAEIIDGVVATVNRKPVLRSEWDESVRFEAFMQQKKLADVGEAERVAALQRMIDRELLTTQMADKDLRPSEQEVKGDIAKLRAQVPGGEEDEAWHALIAQYGLTEAAITAHLKDEVQVMNFIDVQLRPNVRIQDAEIRAYYQQHFASAAQQGGAKAATFGEVEPKIHELLVQQHVDEMLDAWLHNLRQQTNIKTLVPLPALNAGLPAQNSEGK